MEWRMINVGTKLIYIDMDAVAFFSSHAFFF